jgi:hypothetical protein
LTHNGTGFEPQVSDDPVTIDFWSLRFTRLFSRQLRYPSFEIIERGMQRYNPTRVAGGAVTTNQVVEIPEECPTISCVPPHGAVAPTLGVALEPTRKKHQSGNLGREFVLVPQLRHTFAGHSSSHSFMVTKRHPAVFIGSGPRFSYIVEKCCETNTKTGRALTRYCNCVTEHIFMAVNRVLFKTKSW